MLGALIGAGASLLGGALSSRSAKKRQEEQNWYNDPAQMRKRAEKAGFNPLLWAGQGNVQNNVAASGFFGNAVASAGLIVADEMNRAKELDLEQSRLEMDRERLDSLIKTATLRPNVGGVYAQTVRTPSIKKTGAPLQGDTPMGGPAKYGPFQPTSPYAPDASPFEEPTKVMRDDGLTSANPDAPPEFEGDLWTWVREGTALPNMWEVYKRNTMTQKQRQRVDTTKRKAKEAYKEWTAPYSGPLNPAVKNPRLNLPNWLPSISN